MENLLLGVAAFLLVSVLVALARTVIGPTTRDRLMALLLVGTTGAAILAVLAEATGVRALRDVALAVVALAAIVVAVRVQAEEGRR